MPSRIEIEYGTKINEWTVFEYDGHGKYRCVCSCGNEKMVATKSLRNGQSKSCGHGKNQFVDLTNKRFGEWEVMEYNGKQKWTCQCSCGKVKIIDGHELRRGATKSCGHSTTGFKDLTGQRFGEWQVLKRSDKDRYFTCRCSCGEIKDVHSYSLMYGKSTSCGHSTSQFKDLTGQTFGEWTALEYTGNHYWKCQCSCGTIKNVSGVSLRLGNSKSCGCNRYINTINSRLNIYGDFKSGEPREDWQIEILNDKDKLLDAINLIIYNYGRKVSNQEIAEVLGVTRTGVYEATKRFNITDYKLDKYHSLKIQQSEVADFIKSIYNGEIIEDTRKIISPKELDIYIPEKKLAIEFNGDYWHSTINKSKEYHQEKTISCAKQGIHLIHIFEYEWKNKDRQREIKNYLRYLLQDKYKNIENIDDNVKVEELIDSEEYNVFIHNNAFCNKAKSNICIGYRINNEIICMLGFNNMQNNRYTLEEVYCKSETLTLKCVDKILNYFIEKYKPEEITINIDISKFTGNVYTKLGFKIIDSISEPSYTWVSTQNRDIVKECDIEDSEMIQSGYLKIYDCGFLKLGWSSNNG